MGGPSGVFLGFGVFMIISIPAFVLIITSASVIKSKLEKRKMIKIIQEKEEAQERKKAANDFYVNIDESEVEK